MATLQSTALPPLPVQLTAAVATMAVRESSSKFIDVFLGDLFKEVNQIAQNALTTAEAVASSAIIKTKNELLVVIGQAEKSYEESMHKTVNHVGAAIQERLLQIDGMVKDFTNATEVQLGEIERTALVLVQELPIPTVRHNRLISVGPIYLDPTARMVYKLFGSFPAIGKGTPGFVPEMIIETSQGPVVCPLATTPTGTDISIEIPRSVIPEGSLHSYTFLKGTINLPYNDGIIRNHAAPSIYPINITVLPKSPGIVKATIVNIETKKETKSVTSEVLALNGYQHVGFPGDTFTQDFSFYPEDGYLFDVQRQPNLNIIYADKHSSPAWVVIAPTVIVLRLAVTCKEGGPCGNITCSISAQEYKNVPSGKPERVVTLDDLQWGEVRTIQIDPKVEKLDLLEFTSFEKKKYSHGPVPNNKGMIHTDRVSEEHWQITAVPPSDVKTKTVASSNWGGQSILI